MRSTLRAVPATVPDPFFSERSKRGKSLWEPLEHRPEASDGVRAPLRVAAKRIYRSDSKGLRRIAVRAGTNPPTAPMIKVTSKP